MSFSTEDILEELAEACGGRREFLDGKAFTFFKRTGRRHRRNLRRLREYKRLWMRRWRRLNPALARAQDATKYRAAKVDPVRRERLRKAWTKQNRRRREEPTRRQRSRELALKYYHRRVADPAKREALRAYQRARYAAKRAREEA